MRGAGAEPRISCPKISKTQFCALRLWRSRALRVVSPKQSKLRLRTYAFSVLALARYKPHIKQAMLALTAKRSSPIGAKNGYSRKIGIAVFKNRFFLLNNPH